MEGLLKAGRVICKTLSEHFENKKSIFFPPGIRSIGVAEKELTSTKSSHIESDYRKG